MSAQRFLAIGHVTRDEFAGDAPGRLGGSALYAAATAARLGAETTLVTRVGPEERASLAERCAGLGIRLHALPSEVTTTLAFREEGGRRVLRLRRRARAIRLADVSEDVRAAGAVVLGSVARDIDVSLLAGFGHSVAVVAAQGFLREWDAAGTVRPRRWDEAASAVALVAAVVLSEEDVAGDLEEPRRWAAHGRVVVTLGDGGAVVLDDGAERRVPACRADRVVDATGAGDAFAAGLALALARGSAVLDAVRYANAVASFAVEGIGTEGLADADRVTARLAAQPVTRS